MKSATGPSISDALYGLRLRTSLRHLFLLEAGSGFFSSGPASHNPGAHLRQVPSLPVPPVTPWVRQGEFPGRASSGLYQDRLLLHSREKDHPEVHGNPWQDDQAGDQTRHCKGSCCWVHRPFFCHLGLSRMVWRQIGDVTSCKWWKDICCWDFIRLGWPVCFLYFLSLTDFMTPSDHVEIEA